MRWETESRMQERKSFREKEREGKGGGGEEEASRSRGEREAKDEEEARTRDARRYTETARVSLVVQGTLALSSIVFLNFKFYQLTLPAGETPLHHVTLFCHGENLVAPIHLRYHNARRVTRSITQHHQPQEPATRLRRHDEGDGPLLSSIIGAEFPKNIFTNN